MQKLSAAGQGGLLRAAAVGSGGLDLLQLVKLVSLDFEFILDAAVSPANFSHLEIMEFCIASALQLYTRLTKLQIEARE